MRGSFLSRVATCSYYLSRVTTCAACASAAYYIFKKREDPVVETFNELENLLELLERVDGHEQSGYAHITKMRKDCDEIKENVKELRKYTNIHIHEVLRYNPQYRRYFEERARKKETDPKLTD